MARRYPFKVLSWVIAAGVVDCVALTVAVFGQLINVAGTHPALSLAMMVLGGALLAMLMAAAVLEERPTRREQMLPR